MTEVVYVNTGPELTKKVRYGGGGREMEMEEKGESIDDTYLIPDDRVHIYATPDDPNPGPQQDAAQNNTAQEQQGGKIKQIPF